MPVNNNAPLEITAFQWVPDFAQGFVRDLRPRWACEEIGLDYRERLIDATRPKTPEYLQEQPWGQVPVVREGNLQIFESGAILIYIGEKDERLLPRDPAKRMLTLSWLFAALNTIEPRFFELSTVTVFEADKEWAKQRRPGLVEFIGTRLDGLVNALGERAYLTGTFSIADIAMSTVLREAEDTDLLSDRPSLTAYLQRCIERPAFERAMAAQLRPFGRGPEHR